MLTDSWQSMLGFPALFCAPWVVGIVWLLRRTPSGDGTPAPSLGELARRRLNIR